MADDPIIVLDGTMAVLPYPPDSPPLLMIAVPGIKGDTGDSVFPAVIDGGGPNDSTGA